MRVAAALLVAPLLAALTGCLPGTDKPDGSAAAPTPPDPTGRMPGSRDPNAPNVGSPAGAYKLVVTIKMTNVEIPVGMASGSEEIWSYLDEEPIKSVRSASLGRNGFRVGLGRKGSWPDLVRVLRRMTGRSPSQNMIVTMPGAPQPIILKEDEETATIFTFHDDRTLSGKDYPAGDYMLTVVCTLDEDDLSKVFLSAMPQVRTKRRHQRFIMGKTGPEFVIREDVFGFDPLTFQLMVPPKGFIVIGPGANSKNPVTAGHHFLVHKKEGVEFETLLVLMPEAFATPIK